VASTTSAAASPDDPPQAPPGAAETEPDEDDTVLLPPEAGETIEIESSAPLEPTTPAQADLNTEELGTLPGARADALEVVKSLPGVANVSADSFAAGTMVIRGASPEDSTYLLDGVEIPLLYHFGNLQTIIPAEMIADVELLPGGFGVEHGRATGGVVELHSRPSDIDRTTAFAELSFINIAGAIQAPLLRGENLSFLLGFRRSLVDAVVPLALPDDARLSFDTLPQYYDGQLRVDWRPNPSHRASFLAIGSVDRLALVSDYENDHDPYMTGDLRAASDLGLAITSWSYDGAEVDSRAMISAAFVRAKQLVGSERHINFEIPSMTLREDLTWRAHKLLAVRAGGDVDLHSVHFDVLTPLPPQEGVPGGTNFTTDPVTQVVETIDDVWASAYAAADVRPTSRITLTPGLRLDHYHYHSATTLCPRMTASVRLTGKWTARTAVGAYTRPPSGAEFAVARLVPERATHYVAGADYRISEGIGASATGFLTRSRDLVVMDPSRITEDALEAYVNRGTGRVYGLEVIVRAKRNGFYGWLAYTLSRSTRVDGPGLERRLFDYDQTHNLIAVGSWRWRAWRFGGRWQFTTGEPETPIVGSYFDSDSNTYQPIYGEVNSTRMENAHQLDLRVDRTFAFRNWTLSAFLDVTNVYAHARTLGYEYNFDYSEREPSTSMPIFPAIGVRGAF